MPHALIVDDEPDTSKTLAMLIATHNMELAGRMDRRVSLVDGQVVELD